jgi:Uncharacterised nucleotidyltransferase
LNSAQLDNLISVGLRDDVVSWPSFAGADLEQAFVRRCEYHGVAALVIEQGHHHAGWPQTVLEAVRRVALAQAMWELRHQQVLTQLIAALRKSSIASILLKGTSLAYDLYPNPVWRARGDTDIIVPSHDVARCREVLLSQGFERNASIPGELVSYQENWTLKSPEGSRHSIDLHRRVNNSEVLSRLLSYEELRDQAQPLPALCSDALAAGRVHSLLLACVHRATHKHNPYYTHGIAHYGGNRLIWLYDIHLLATHLDYPKWDAFLQVARDKGVGAVCLEGLDITASRFNTVYPERILVGLSECGRDERATDYLHGSRVHQQWIDFRAIEGLGNKFQFARETLLPTVAYMRWKYHDARFSWLPWLYVRRAFAGIRKRLTTFRPEGT